MGSAEFVRKGPGNPLLPSQDIYQADEEGKIENNTIVKVEGYIVSLKNLQGRKIMILKKAVKK